MGLRLTKGDEDAPVTHAPSNVKDAAASKSFIFINIVARSAVMGTLLRAAFTLCERLGSVARVFARVRTRHA